MRVFKNGVLRGIFVYKREKVTDVAQKATGGGL